MEGKTGWNGVFFSSLIEHVFVKDLEFHIMELWWESYLDRAIRFLVW